MLHRHTNFSRENKLVEASVGYSLAQSLGCVDSRANYSRGPLEGFEIVGCIYFFVFGKYFVIANAPDVLLQVLQSFCV